MKPLKLQKELTIRDSHAVDVYFSEIQKYKTLTPDEEAALCERIKAGDAEAKKLLVLHNLRFVISVAKRYQSLGYRLGDLIAIGNIGILRAAEAFDYTRGFKFISYAVWWIRQQIMSEIGYKANGIRIPGNRVSIMYKINRFIDQFYTENQRDPYIEEIAEHFDLDYEVVRDIMAASEDLSSINTPIDGDSEHEMQDLMADEEDTEGEYTENDYAKRIIREALKELSPRDRYIACRLYGIGCKEEDTETVAASLMCGKESIRTAKKRILKQMEEIMRRQGYAG